MVKEIIAQTRIATSPEKYKLLYIKLFTKYISDMLMKYINTYTSTKFSNNLLLFDLKTIVPIVLKLKVTPIA